MDIGVLSGPVRRFAGDNRPLQQMYQDGVDNALKYEQMGFDWFLASEHHFMADQWNPSPLMVLAAISQKTSSIRLGTNVLLTPMYNAVRLAEDTATLDNLSNGRFDLVCGAGSVRGEFETIGLDADTRVGRMWETMEVIRRSYAEPQFDHSGKHYNHPNIRMTTEPVQKPFPIWYGGAGPKNGHRAGREGYHILLHGGSSLEPYWEGLKLSGLTPDDVNVGVCFVSIIVVETEAKADEAREVAAAAGRAQAEDYRRTRDLSKREPNAPLRPLYNAGGGYIGTPEQVLKQMEPDYKNGVYTHLVPQLVGSNQELFAREVMPVLKTWGRKPVKTKAKP